MSPRPSPFRTPQTASQGPALRRSKGFTIVEVMMAATILVVGFIGLIEAVSVTSNMMDHARRQTLANQILNREIENLRIQSWSTITGYSTASTAVPISPQLWPAWNAARYYSVNTVVTYNGAWYRCSLANGNQSPDLSPGYWTSVDAGATTDIVTYSGATYSVTRTLKTTDPFSNFIREVTFTVTWVVNTNRRDASNNPLTFTFSRSASAWVGKYGLRLSYQRS